MEDRIKEIVEELKKDYTDLSKEELIGEIGKQTALAEKFMNDSDFIKATLANLKVFAIADSL